MEGVKVSSTHKNLNVKLYRIIRKMGVPRSQVQLRAQLTYDLGFDNFDMNIFLFYLESFFNIEITDNEIPKLQTISQTISFIEEKLQVA